MKSQGTPKEFIPNGDAVVMKVLMQVTSGEEEVNRKGGKRKEGSLNERNDRTESRGIPINHQMG